jgi:hypothetical protein
MARRGEACTGYQTHIACADNTYTHNEVLQIKSEVNGVRPIDFTFSGFCKVGMKRL